MNEFKPGDEVWHWKTNGYHAEIQMPADLYLECCIAETLERGGGIYTTEGDWITEDDLKKCFHSKQEAIDAMIAHIKTL